jgi:hypothetical protein
LKKPICYARDGRLPLPAAKIQNMKSRERNIITSLNVKSIPALGKNIIVE